jgi:FkbM family methyltransferase
MRSILRKLTPFGLVELRRRRLRLRRLGISSKRHSSLELDEALQTCRFELWPPELRHAPPDWGLVDVGANVGDYVAAVLKLITPQQVIAIEPLPSCHSQLASVLSKHSNHRLIKAAAGDAEGETEMRFTGDSKMSSILSPQTGIAEAYQPGAFDTRQMLKVPLVRIDDVVPAGLRVGLLKLDVQGFEMSVLRGAEATLERTMVVLVEINYKPHYEGSADFNDVHGFLVGRSFRLFGVSAPYSGREGPLWADAVYSKIG